MVDKADATYFDGFIDTYSIYDKQRLQDTIIRKLTNLAREAVESMLKGLDVDKLSPFKLV
jgi:hypothetical protein